MTPVQVVAGTQGWLIRNLMLRAEERHVFMIPSSVPGTSVNATVEETFRQALIAKTASGGKSWEACMRTPVLIGLVVSALGLPQICTSGTEQDCT